jgi:hypothetical protein
MKETENIMKEVEVTYRLAYTDLAREEFDQECEHRFLEEDRFKEVLAEKREQPKRFVDFQASKVTVTREVVDLLL